VRPVGCSAFAATTAKFLKGRAAIMTPVTITIANSKARATVDLFLAAVVDGKGIPVELYASDATLDATVPNWRFTARGPEAIAAEYRRWFGFPAAFEELSRFPLPDGEVVTYLLTWVESGVPHAAHHCHLLVVGDDGQIKSDVVFCGGRWPAGLLAEMAAGL
jgi:hypothetical protein